MLKLTGIKKNNIYYLYPTYLLLKILKLSISNIKKICIYLYILIIINFKNKSNRNNNFKIQN